MPPDQQGTIAPIDSFIEVNVRFLNFRKLHGAVKTVEANDILNQLSVNENNKFFS